MKGARFNPNLTAEGMTVLLGLESSKTYELLFSPTELFAVDYTYRQHPSKKSDGYFIMSAIHVTVNPDGTFTAVKIPGDSDRFSAFTQYLSGTPFTELPMLKKGKEAKAYYTAPTPAIVETPSEGQMMEFVRVFETNGNPPLLADISKYVLAPLLIGKAISPSDERAADIEAQVSKVIQAGVAYVKQYNGYADNQNRSKNASDSGVRKKDVDAAQSEYVKQNEELDALFEKDDEQKKVEAARLAARQKREGQGSSSSSSSGPAAAGAPQNGQARRKKTRRSLRKKRTTRRR